MDLIVKRSPDLFIIMLHTWLKEILCKTCQPLVLSWIGNMYNDEKQIIDGNYNLDKN